MHNTTTTIHGQVVPTKCCKKEMSFVEVEGLLVLPSRYYYKLSFFGGRDLNRTRCFCKSPCFIGQSSGQSNVFMPKWIVVLVRDLTINCRVQPWLHDDHCPFYIIRPRHVGYYLTKRRTDPLAMFI